MNNQIIYIPAYIEQGVELLEEARELLSDIESEIDRGISQILNSGYAGEIPYIGKEAEASSAISSMQKTISTITGELENYNNGTSDLPNDAIIIADIDTASKYNIDPNRIYCSLKDYSKNSSNVEYSGPILTAPIGYIEYDRADGKHVKETWCDLPVDQLVKNLREYEGIDLPYWIRDDGVKMLGEYVMVASDVRSRVNPWTGELYYQGGTCSYGDIVETSLGPGIIVDYGQDCVDCRKRFGEDYIRYEMYTAWHEQPYQGMVYSRDYKPKNYANDPLLVGSNSSKKPSLVSSEKEENSESSDLSTKNQKSTIKKSVFWSTKPSIRRTTTNPTPQNIPTELTNPISQKPSTDLTNPTPQNKPTDLTNPTPQDTSTESTGPITQSDPTGSTDPVKPPADVKTPQNDNYHNPETTPNPPDNLNNHYESGSDNDYSTPPTSYDKLTQPSNINETTTNPSLEHQTGVNIIKPEISEPTDLENTLNVPQESNNSSGLNDNTLLTPKDPVKMTDTPKSFNPIPIITAGGLAIAGGVGTKIYLDHKKNSDNGSSGETNEDNYDENCIEKDNDYSDTE